MRQLLLEYVAQQAGVRRRFLETEHSVRRRIAAAMSLALPGTRQGIDDFARAHAYPASGALVVLEHPGAIEVRVTVPWWRQVVTLGWARRAAVRRMVDRASEWCAAGVLVRVR